MARDGDSLEDRRRWVREFEVDGARLKPVSYGKALTIMAANERAPDDELTDDVVRRAADEAAAGMDGPGASLFRGMVVAMARRELVLRGLITTGDSVWVLDGSFQATSWYAVRAQSEDRWFGVQNPQTGVIG